MERQILQNLYNAGILRSVPSQTTDEGGSAPSNKPPTRPLRPEIGLISPEYTVLESPFDGNNLGYDHFSREMLRMVDKGIRHLQIDLYRASFAQTIYPLEDLSPLPRFRNLTSLTIYAMQISYQPHIWEVLWVNKGIKYVTLGMEGQQDRLKVNEIVDARRRAVMNEGMLDLVGEVNKGGIQEKIRLMAFSLTNFIVDEAPFRFFDVNAVSLTLKNCTIEGGHGWLRPLQELLIKNESTARMVDVAKEREILKEMVEKTGLGKGEED